MRNDVQIDLITQNGNGFSGSGSVAQILMKNNFNVNALRTNDLLRKDEWVQYDEALISVAKDELVGVADLFSAGLTYNVPNALGTTRVEWERVGDMDDAEINMSGVTEGTRDRTDFDLLGVPLPIIHKDFRINIRTLEASRTTGQPLDTTYAELAGRKVSERIEKMLFQGYSTLQLQSSTIYGYKTAPNRNTGAISNWASGATTGETIIDNVLAMILALQTDNQYGPYTLYVPLDYYNRLLDDYKAESDKSILMRLMEIPTLSSIKISRNLTGGASGEVIMVSMQRQVVDMIDGLQPTTVMWDTNGGFTVNFKVMAIMVPRMKSDKSTQSGIAHFSV